MAGERDDVKFTRRLEVIIFRRMEEEHADPLEMQYTGLETPTKSIDRFVSITSTKQPSPPPSLTHHVTTSSCARHDRYNVFMALCSYGPSSCLSLPLTSSW